MQATLCYFEYLGKSSIALNASFLCPLNINFVEIPFLIDFNVRVKIFLRLLMLLPNLRRIMCPRRTWDIVLNRLLWFDRGRGKRRICSLQYLAAVWPLQLQGFGKSNRRKSFRLMARIHGHARLNICIYIRIVTLKLYKSGSVCLHQIFTFLPYENKYKLYIYIYKRQRHAKITWLCPEKLNICTCMQTSLENLDAASSAQIAAAQSALTNCILNVKQILFSFFSTDVSSARPFSFIEIPYHRTET